MPIVPNPYILLGSLIAAVCLFLSGFFYGAKYQRGEQALDVVTVQNKALDDANISVEAEQQRALASAKQEAERRSAFQITKLKGERDAALKASSNCNRDNDSLRLLNDTIESANGKEATPDKLPLSVPSSDSAS